MCFKVSRRYFAGFGNTRPFQHCVRKHHELAMRRRMIKCGLPCIERVSLLVAQELTLFHPNIVNTKKNTDLLYSTPTFLASHT